MNVLEILDLSSWNIQNALSADFKYKITTVLEDGKILFLPNLAFELFDTERSLLVPDYLAPKSKNISFDINTHQLGGVARDQNQNTISVLLRKMMQRYAEQAQLLVTTLLQYDERKLATKRTSFRPAEISGRPSSYRKDDTRLHVDAFPSSPTQGQRILRIFTNVNPVDKPRYWRVGESFGQVLEKFFSQLPPFSALKSQCLHWLKITKTYRTRYDHLMLHLHDNMKKNIDYQKNVQQEHVHFPPGSTWIVYTDLVSHAAMSGQHLFEQTFHLPVHAMQSPEKSPLKVLEKFSNRKLI